MSNLAWYAIIMTQIITESLPISSSGHVILLCMLLGIAPYDFVLVPSENASWRTQQLMARSVDHCLHGPTLIIVALFFYRRWTTLLTGWRKTLPIIYRLIFYVGIADFITGLCF